MKTMKEKTLDVGDDNPKKKEVDSVPYYKLFSYADRSDMLMMLIGTISSVASGLGMPVLMIMLGQVIDSFGSADKINEVNQVALKTLYLGITVAIATFLQMSCWIVTGERQARRIRVAYLQAVLKQDITFFDKKTTTAEVIVSLTCDTILVQDAIGEKVGKFIQLTTTFFASFTVAFIKGWSLSLLVLSCIPPLALTGILVSKYVSKVSYGGQVANTEAAEIVAQTMGAIRTVASFTGEREAIEKYNKILPKTYIFMTRQALASGIGFGVAISVMYSFEGLAMWYGSRLILDKGFNGGNIISIIFNLAIGGIALGQAFPCLSIFIAGKAASYKMFKVIKRKPLIDISEKKGIILENIKGDINLKEIYFSYPTRPDVQVLSGFSLCVPSGSTAALVGQSGSGKSTVLSLVERFYDPQGGEVLIDGVNLKELQLKWVRENVIGLVSQEPTLFATTIKENIIYGKEKATEEEIKRAVTLANAANFIDKLPMGLETMISGTKLSGGQKQRIAIARAILKNPKILLLDEATSALDVKSEQIVKDALERVILNRTTIIVAHRLTTIKDAKIINVVHQGKIVEQGSHAELIKDLNGAYSQLIRLQEAAAIDEFIPPLQEIGIETSVFHQESNDLDDSKKEVVDQQDQLVQNKVSFSQLAYLNKTEVVILFFGLFAAMIKGLMAPTLGFLLSRIIKILYEPPDKLRRDSRIWSFMFVALGCIGLIIIPLQHYLIGIAGAKLVQRVRSMCFGKIVHQEMSWFDDHTNSSGAIESWLSTDALRVQNLVGDSLSLWIQNISTITAAVVIALLSNWQFTLVLIALLPLFASEGYARMKFIQSSLNGDGKVKYEEANQVAFGAVGGIRTVASFNAEEKVAKLYNSKCTNSMKQGNQRGLISGVGLGIAVFIIYVGASICFYAGGNFVRDKKATFEQIFRVIFVLFVSVVDSSETTAMAPDFNKARDSSASIFKILETRPKIDSSSNTGLTLDNVQGNIDFQNVSFKYPSRPNVQIFEDFCLNIPSGTIVALVGESGCGKSTVISLLQRFYDVDSGRIMLDGVEIQRFKINWLRQQMGLVSQEPVLFNDTIKANVAYGQQGIVSEEEIILATKASNAHNFISALPEGYDTYVGEKGIQLSGGQKQRIAIARAILKNPKILLLDEATSALDAESEHIVQEAFERVMKNRTTIVVAHRLSSIKGADVIAVVKNGVIIEQGKHEVLVNKKDGVYASLHDMSS
ncbi:hypothetical protein MKW98_027661 [Papaver atlanticum]|uniref:Uncharacterized protein n=1 Tax=Papaver atlanticum TaxID=357466 RepID=A0AAD4STJ0_9MAGN|nr:hypothetical protein MKW98_027661 [Papaver atlanticum]